MGVSNIFEGLCILLLGPAAKMQQLEDSLLKHSALVRKGFSDRVTHIVVNSTVKSNKTIAKAMASGLPVLVKEWVDACIAEGGLVPVEGYSYAAPPSHSPPSKKATKRPRNEAASPPPVKEVVRGAPLTPHRPPHVAVLASLSCEEVIDRALEELGVLLRVSDKRFALGKLTLPHLKVGERLLLGLVDMAPGETSDRLTEAFYSVIPTAPHHQVQLTHPAAIESKLRDLRRLQWLRQCNEVAALCRAHPADVPAVLGCVVHPAGDEPGEYLLHSLRKDRRGDKGALPYLPSSSSPVALVSPLLPYPRTEPPPASAPRAPHVKHALAISSPMRAAPFVAHLAKVAVEYGDDLPSGLSDLSALRVEGRGVEHHIYTSLAASRPPSDPPLDGLSALVKRHCRLMWRGLSRSEVLVTLRNGFSSLGGLDFHASPLEALRNAHTEAESTAFLALCTVVAAPSEERSKEKRRLSSDVLRLQHAEIDAELVKSKHQQARLHECARLLREVEEDEATNTARTSFDYTKDSHTHPVDVRHTTADSPDAVLVQYLLEIEMVDMK